MNWVCRPSAQLSAGINTRLWSSDSARGAHVDVALGFGLRQVHYDARMEACAGEALLILDGDLERVQDFVPLCELLAQGYQSLLPKLSQYPNGWPRVMNKRLESTPK